MFRRRNLKLSLQLKNTIFTILAGFALINLLVLPREAFGSVKTSNFMSEFRAGRELHELTRQGGKLVVF